ncbi:MAG: 50S ribosomal protein L2 [SAR202 cluster bacterium]|nr:50S ribosomal protein L2 [SAR202 cluster bacterium]
MPLKKLRPTSKGVRQALRPDFAEVTRTEPHKPLTEGKHRTGGRNVRGKVTMRHQGGGHKQLWRKVDFKRDKVGVPGQVESIEYDPNRSCRIALVLYKDGERRYHLAPDGLKVGDTLMSGPTAEIRMGNALPLVNIPTGTTVHNIELQPGMGGKMCRSAGTSAQLLARDDHFALLRMPSGEVRQVISACFATIGAVGFPEHKNTIASKAGRSRHLGKRPAVRGSAMTPRDHPHGGGEGRAGVGMKYPKTPWGRPARGVKTRRRQHTDVFRVRDRRAK